MHVPVPVHVCMSVMLELILACQEYISVTNAKWNAGNGLRWAIGHIQFLSLFVGKGKQQFSWVTGVAVGVEESGRVEEIKTDEVNIYNWSIYLQPEG